MHSFKRFGRVFGLAATLVVAALPGWAQYSAHRDGEIVQLEDTKHKIVISILPSLNDVVFDMKVNGQGVLRFPYASIEEFKTRPSLVGGTWKESFWVKPSGF